MAHADVETLQDALRRAHERLRLLIQTTHGLLLSGQPQVYVGSIFESLSEHMGVALYFNYLAEERDGAQRLRLDSYAGVTAPVDEWLDMERTVCGQSARERRRIVVDDVQKARDVRVAGLRPLGVTAYVCHPLLAHDRLVGTLAFGLRDRARFTDEELELLSALADQVAVTIDLRRAHEAERRAREEAEHANAVKGQFLATMSHELRTPLTAVLGLTDLMVTEVVGPMNDKQKEYLGRIRSSGWHLVSIIDEILTFSRSEAGKEEIRLTRVDVAEIVRGVAGMLAGEASVQGLTLRLRGADGRVVITSDGGKVRQIVTNLLGNALKYTEAGSVTVELDATAADHIEVRVRDTGRGIPADRLEDIFEPFTQLQQPGVGRAGGTGLGLTVSRKLARLLGGDVTVSSVPGAGSTFVLQLPRRISV